MEYSHLHPPRQKILITKLKTHLIAQISRHNLTKTIIHQSKEPSNQNEKIFHINQYSSLKLFTLWLLSL